MRGVRPSYVNLSRAFVRRAAAALFTSITRRDATRHEVTQHDMIQHDVIRRDTARSLRERERCEVSEGVRC